VEGFDPATSFGPDVAATYDEDEVRGDEEATVAFLAELAGEGPALELAIGTGRIGLPLATTGVRVHGIDLSPDMVERLRAKPGGADLDVTMGDFAAVEVPGRFRLIYVVFNTFHNLLTQDDQVRCFRNVAEHLTDDGAFVIEAMVPWRLHTLRDSQYVDAEAIGTDEVTFDVARIDPVGQLYEENHVTLSPAGIRFSPIVNRYCYPSELDLMARLAGLRLIDRWGGWKGEPFTADSRRHISVWGR
jgi:SAM-dependent methyltransferase